MVKGTAILAKTAVSTTDKTHCRVTFARSGLLTFVCEGFGSSPTDPKFIMEVFRGSTGGTPGSAPTADAGTAPCINKLDSTHEAPSALLSIAGVFTDEVGYTKGKLVQRPTFHPQHNRQSVTVAGIAGETYDCRLIGDTGTPGTVSAQLTVFFQG